MADNIIRLPFNQIINKGDKDNITLIKQEVGEGGKLRKYGLKKTVNKKGIKTKVPKQYQGAWTLNIDVVANHKFDTIIYLTPEFQYKITKEKAWKKGKIDNFNGENKIIIPCRYFDVTTWMGA